MTPRGEDDAYRRRLEGRAELLDATRLRYRALDALVGGLTWRAKLRRNVALLREVGRTQREVDETLALVERRARTEGWHADSATMRCAAEVLALRTSVESKVRKRLRREAEGLSLLQCLERLEQLAAIGPRLVLPGQRLATAAEVLPPTLPELSTLAGFGQALESLFNRPLQPSERLPFTSSELEAIERAWPAGETALAAAWARVALVDTSGGVERLLRRRARRAPLRKPRTGPEVLLAAEFWKGLALSRLRDATSRVSPVVCADGELWAVVRWLCDRERSPAARLRPAEGLSEARAGLMELAYELQVVPGKRALPDGAWDGLYERAERAEALSESDPDLVRLRDNLRLFLRVLSKENRRPLQPSRRLTLNEPDSLKGLVAAMRDRMAAT